MFVVLVLIHVYSINNYSPEGEPMSQSLAQYFRCLKCITLLGKNKPHFLPAYLSLTSFYVFLCTVSYLQQAAKDDVVLSTTGVTCVSVIIPVCLMESAARTMNPNAPQVSLLTELSCQILFLYELTNNLTSLH